MASSMLSPMVALLSVVLLISALAAGSQAAPDPLPRPAAVAAAKANQQQQQPQPVAAVVDVPFFGRCPNGSDWISFRQHCYLHVENPTYWYTAEQYCKSRGGNLASIVDRYENTFLSKLTYCQETWIGRYAVNVDQLRSANNYRWTDGKPNTFYAHNYKGIVDYHQPLIVLSDMGWENRVYHAKSDFLCKVPNAITATPEPSKCQPDWTHHNGYCYLMPQPHVTATYIEADFFCRGRGAHVASLHSAQEVRIVNLLDLQANTCPEETWIGLVKLNPCKEDFSTGEKICFKWSDRSGDYKKFPQWHPGSPNNDTVTNCVVLKDRAIRSVPCYQRNRFVCKKLA